jgi:hypothetical protein
MLFSPVNSDAEIVEKISFDPNHGFMSPGYWRHRDFLDVDFLIIDPVYGGTTFLRAKGYWVNQKSRDMIHAVDEIKILKKDLKNWARVNY